MPPGPPKPLLRAALSVFRRLPGPLRRRAVHAGTPNYTVGAVALVRNGAGHVLLLQQRHREGWSLPGGLLRTGESPERALARELAEELHLSVDAAELTGSLPVAVVDAQTRRVDLVYVLQREEVGAVDDIEVLEARWFPPDALPECSQGTDVILHGCQVAPPVR
jgi:8-oxo-dGTP pyrophosphatase MutT (NUDIX family)